MQFWNGLQAVGNPPYLPYVNLSSDHGSATFGNVRFRAARCAVLEAERRGAPRLPLPKQGAGAISGAESGRRAREEKR